VKPGVKLPRRYDDGELRGRQSKRERERERARARSEGALLRKSLIEAEEEKKRGEWGRIAFTTLFSFSVSHALSPRALAHIEKASSC
jgi:hypothetical protein